MEKVILVDENDNITGTMEKMEAHRKGALHRAFSVLIFNSQGEILLQKRSRSKYHSGGLWTNTCCSHPMPDEAIEVAARRRLIQEMGIDVQPYFAYKFMYRADLNDNLIENELDYVFLGTFDGVPDVNADEVEDWKFVSPEQLRSDISKNPEAYTYWFKIIVNDPQFDLLMA